MTDHSYSSPSEPFQDMDDSYLAVCFDEKCQDRGKSASRLGLDTSTERIEVPGESFTLYRVKRADREAKGGLCQLVESIRKDSEVVRAERVYDTLNTRSFSTDGSDLVFMYAGDDRADIGLTNDPEEPDHYSLVNAKALEAWSELKGDRSISIAVVDSGIDARHPAFRERREDGSPYSDPFELDTFSRGGTDSQGDSEHDPLRSMEIFFSELQR